MMSKQTSEHCLWNIGRSILTQVANNYQVLCKLLSKKKGKKEEEKELEVMFSNIRIYQDFLEGLVKWRPSGPVPRVSDWSWNVAQEFGFLTRSQVMLKVLVQGPHFENLWCEVYESKDRSWGVTLLDSHPSRHAWNDMRGGSAICLLFYLVWTKRVASGGAPWR